MGPIALAGLLGRLQFAADFQQFFLRTLGLRRQGLWSFHLRAFPFFSAAASRSASVLTAVSGARFGGAAGPLGTNGAGALTLDAYMGGYNPLELAPALALACCCIGNSRRFRSAAARPIA